MRKSVYCLLSKLPSISAVSGDRINELNIYRALSVNYDVYYNNRKLNFNDTINFGTNPRDRVSPPNRKYDFYYVRNNPLLFGKLPHPKFYFCVPNHQICFRRADCLAFPTRAWLNLVKDRKFKAFRIIYQKGDYIPNNLIVFNQITYPEDLKNNSTTLHYRNLFGGDFVIGHFGRLVKSNYPYSFIKILPKLIGDNPGKKIKVIFSGNINMALPPRIKVVKKISKEHIKYAISACDVLLYNQDYQGHFAGSLKIMDAMSYGIPVLTPKYMARVDELGEEYPLYYDNECSLLSGLNHIIKEPEGAKEISDYLKKRAEYYNLENSAIRYKEQIDKII